MGYHILIIPGLRPNSKYKTHGSFVQDHANALIKAGHKIGMIHISIRSIFSIKEGNLKQFTFSRIKDNSKGNINELQIYRWFLGGSPVITEMRYAKLVVKMYKRYMAKFGKPDIIHAHFTLWPGIGAYHISKIFNVPYIITEHSTAYSRKKIKQKYASLVTKVLNHAQSIICVSNGLADAVRSYTKNSNMEVIGNPVDTDFFCLDNSEKNPGIFTIFTLGYLTKKKGIDLLVTAFGQLFLEKAFNSSVKLVVGGPGPEMENLRFIAEKYNIINHVDFLGELTREQVRDQMQNANIFALPSRHETFGVVYIEAMAAGKPVIAANTDGPRDFINKNVGYIIDVDDLEELKKSLLDAYANKLEWFRKQNAIKNYIINRFSAIEFAKKTTAVYEKVLTK